MKIIKVLVNSILSGLFFCLLLALLISDLNINLYFDLIFLGQLSLFLFITYGAALSFICFALFFVIQFFAGKKFQIAFISPSFLSISFSLILFFFLWLFRNNRGYFRSLLSLDIRNTLSLQSNLLLVLVVFGLVAFYIFHRYRKRAFYFLVYFILFAACLVYIVNQRFMYPMPIKTQKVAHIDAKDIDKRITIIGFEGLSFDFLIPAIDGGKLPNFSWLLDNGCWGRLETLSPNEPIVFNNSFNSGKRPAKHRMISQFTFHPLLVSKPIEVTPRNIFFRQLTKPGLLKVLPNTSSPFVKDIWQILEENDTPFLKRDWPYAFQYPLASPKAVKGFDLYFKDLKEGPGPLFDIIEQAFFRDFEYEEMVSQVKSKTPHQILYFLLSGLNSVETYFYKYSFPGLYGNIDQEDISRYGSVIAKYYEYYDNIVGKYLAALKEDELLVVFSPHGIEALPLWKRFVEGLIGNPDVSATHEGAPEGMIFFYGKDIIRGKHIQEMRLIDITPTLLNYMGLPVGKDMDGIVNSSIFLDEFKAENPIWMISSYEEIWIKSLKK